MEQALPAYPRARLGRLVIRELPDELLIYDEQTNKAHCLNATAAQVWRSCDGTSTAARIAERVSQQTGSSLEEQTVWLALAKLQKLDLLEEGVVPPEMMRQMGRRDAVRMLGLASLVAVPVITSIVAPTPAQAASVPNCGDCPPP